MESPAAELPSGIVTFVFTDIEGSSRLFHRLGERYPPLLERHNGLLRSVWTAHDGREVKTEGDAFFVAFQDAAMAIAACADAQLALDGESWPDDAPVRVRMGIHSGLAYPRDDDYIAYAVHQAARVVSAGHGGQVIVSEMSADLAKGRLDDRHLLPLGRFRLRDFDEPVGLFQVAGADLPSQFSAVRAVPADGHNLVRPATSFVGRGDVADAVSTMLDPGCLVSLLGPGGVGKTRLAIEVGLASTESWVDGVWFVDFSSVLDPRLIATALADAVGCPAAGESDPWSMVLDHLRAKRLLVILDNCEHLVHAMSAHVRDLVRTCPGVGLLTTSREPLGVTGEQVWRLEPLDSSGPGGGPAVELFAARATGARPDFRLDAGGDPPQAEVVAAICRRLDGLPLAIELAAARVAVLSPNEILEGLEDRFRLLRQRDRSVPERQRTMETTLDWSNRLLDPDEQRVLRRLSVFSASFDLDTAMVALVDDDLDADDMPELVWSLADKSLVAVELSANSTRYRLLESIREYARRQFTSDVEPTAVATRLANRYFEVIGPWVRTSETASVVAVEIDNIRGVIEALAERDPGRACFLVHTVAGLHRYEGTAAAGERELSRWVNQITAPVPERVAVLADLCGLLIETGRKADAMRVAEAAWELASEVGPPPWYPAAPAIAVAHAAARTGEPERAEAVLRAALDEVHDDLGRAMLLNQLTITAVVLGDLDLAYSSEVDSLALVERTGAAVATSHSNLAELEYQRGRVAEAARHQLAALRAAAQAGDRVVVAFSMIIAARLSCDRGDLVVAAELQAGADAILEVLGRVLHEEDREASDQVMRRARSMLGAERFEIACETGRALSLPDAIACSEDVLAR